MTNLDLIFIILLIVSGILFILMLFCLKKVKLEYIFCLKNLLSLFFTLILLLNFIFNLGISDNVVITIICALFTNTSLNSSNWSLDKIKQKISKKLNE